MSFKSFMKGATSFGKNALNIGSGGMMGQMFGWNNAPDFGKIAQQQAAGNQALLQEQTRANRPNQVGPWGSTTWGQDAGGNWTQTQSFDPYVQSRLDSIKQGFAQPMDWNTPGIDPNTVREDVTKASFDRFKSLMDPVWNQREDSTRARMAAEGWDPNAVGVTSEWSRLGDQRGEDYSRAAWDAIGAGGAEADRALRQRSSILAERAAQRTQPLTELQGLMGTRVQNPDFAHAGYAPGPDLMGAAGMQYSADRNTQQDQAQSTQQIMRLLGMFAGGM